MFSPSKGFVDLVSRVHSPEGRMYKLSAPVSSRPEALWENFLFPMFVGRMRRGAQVSYAVEILRDHLSLDRTRNAQSDAQWSSRIRDRINRTLRTLGDTPPDGLKRFVLESIRADADDLKLASMAAGMADFIDRVDPKEIRTIRGDFDREFEFVERAVGRSAIPHVGYTRFVLWMHNCNAGWTLTPPSGPVRWALTSENLGYLGARTPSWGEDEAAADLGIANRSEFGMLCTKYRNLNQSLQPSIDTALTPMETQSAAWILGTTHSLMAGDAKARSKLNAKKLVHYLEGQSWSVGKYVDTILDIDRAEPLVQDLKRCLFRP